MRTPLALSATEEALVDALAGGELYTQAAAEEDAAIVAFLAHLRRRCAGNALALDWIETFEDAWREKAYRRNERALSTFAGVALSAERVRRSMAPGAQKQRAARVEKARAA